MSKQLILTMLKEQREGYLSGEAMSQRLGISRAAVNKAVNSLRQDGYEIESATRRGYRLLSSPDLLTEGEIRPWLQSHELGNPLLCFPTIDSTNSYLKRESANLPSGAVAVADQQTGGRGRLGRSFHSPKRTGIYLSVLLKPVLEPAPGAEPHRLCGSGHLRGGGAGRWIAARHQVDQRSGAERPEDLRYSHRDGH